MVFEQLKPKFALLEFSFVFFPWTSVCRMYVLIFSLNRRKYRWMCGPTFICFLLRLGGLKGFGWDRLSHCKIIYLYVLKNVPKEFHTFLKYICAAQGLYRFSFKFIFLPFKFLFICLNKVTVQRFCVCIFEAGLTIINMDPWDADNSYIYNKDCCVAGNQVLF